MKEHPILFSTPMVRAILDGRKTQTRRALKPQPEWVDRTGLTYSSTGEPIPSGWCYSDCRGSGPFDPETHVEMHGCPYGRGGDHLWVRETALPHFPWFRWQDVPEDRRDRRFVHYRAGPDEDLIGWRPSIHMPRWASRLTLEVCSVRVERVNSITAADAHAEGISEKCHGCEPGICQQVGPACSVFAYSQVQGFRRLWDSLNAKRGYPFDAGCYVWVISFRVLADPARAGG